MWFCDSLLPLFPMRFSGYLLIAVGILGLGGCRSAMIDADVANHTADTLSVLEVDYPSASFGTQSLGPGQDFHYRFKVLGSGPTALLWTDAAHKDHKISGPTLREGDEGKLTITFNPGASPTWNLDLTNR